MAQIFTMVPDSVLIEVWNLDTAKKVWEAVCAKYEAKALTRVYLLANNYQILNKVLAAYNISAWEDKNSK